METIQYVDGIPNLPVNNLQVRVPRITADKFKYLTPLFTKPVEEPRQRLDSALLTNPQQLLTVTVDLVC